MSMKRSGIRLPPETIAQLDQLADRVRKALPGRRVSRAGLVRSILDGELGNLQTLTGPAFDAMARRVVEFSKGTLDEG